MIQDLVKGGSASEVKSCRHREADSHEWSETLLAGVQGLLKGHGSFWVLNAQICILLHSRDSFLSFMMACIIFPKPIKIVQIF